MKKSTPWAIKGLLIRPGEEPSDYFATNDLDDITMSALELNRDDDFVDSTPITEKLVMVHFVAEEGVKPNRLPSAITSEPFVRMIFGNVFICRKDDVGFTSLEPGDREIITERLEILTPEDVERYKGGELYGFKKARAD